MYSTTPPSEAKIKITFTQIKEKTNTQAWRETPLTVGSGGGEGGGGGEGAEHEQRGDEVPYADGHGDAPVGAPPRGRAAPERHRPRYAPRHGATSAAAAIPTDATLVSDSRAPPPRSRTSAAPHETPMANALDRRRRCGARSLSNPAAAQDFAPPLVAASAEGGIRGAAVRI